VKKTFSKVNNQNSMHPFGVADSAIRLLKALLGATIFLCMFLPLAQCSTSAPIRHDDVVDEVASQVQPFVKEVVVSELVYGEQSEFSFWSLYLPFAFCVPLLFAILPTFFGSKEFLRLTLQSLYGFWFCAESYNLVFNIGTPLSAGYLLIISTIVFLLTSLVEICVFLFSKFRMSG